MMLSLLVTVTALWSYTNGNLDASASTGANKFTWQTMSASNTVLATLGRGKVLAAPTTPGTYKIRLTACDTIPSKQVCATKTQTITVKAPDAPHVDTVRITRVDTIRVASKPDTVLRVDTVLRSVVSHDTVAYTLNAPWLGSIVPGVITTTDSQPSGIWVAESVIRGRLEMRDRKYRACPVPKNWWGIGQVFPACVAPLVSKDSAIKLLAPPSVSVKAP
jgi:hypothetical protein